MTKVLKIVKIFSFVIQRIKINRVANIPHYSNRFSNAVSRIVIIPLIVCLPFPSFSLEKSLTIIKFYALIFNDWSNFEVLKDFFSRITKSVYVFFVNGDYDFNAAFLVRFFFGKFRNLTNLRRVNEGVVSMLLAINIRIDYKVII